MNIGIPKERRPFEYRVGLSPAGVELLCQNGHTVFVEHDAGIGAGFADQEYERAGARIVYSAEELYGRADLVLKVARPLDEELDLLKPGCTLAGLLHLASARRSKIDLLLEKKITTIAYEQVSLPDGSLPLLRPFSQIGGAMAAQVAARLLQNNYGGNGVLLGGIPGVPPAEVVILGAGVVGSFAARAFVGLGAHVTVLDKSVEALTRISQCAPSIVTMPATERNIERVCLYADVLVGAVLVPGARAPQLVSRQLVRRMKPRSVILDISIDQGGCVETSRPTTHDQPTFIEENIIHYCVPNMPGVVARTATYGFVNAAMDYILQLANLGVDKAIEANPALATGVTTYRGELRNLSRLSK
ncbi:MAG: alanine dehydrogenase [Anaerolineales bacterium]|nr:alanine dehydrogenase [Anaerolineales bacterium]MCX7608147.1 alanine dehydrogenase [Anaerolineales bacterium]MDW8227186.1 alanine dehydrogenase [Anaerolineales bacterium]